MMLEEIANRKNPQPQNDESPVPVENRNPVQLDPKIEDKIKNLTESRLSGKFQPSK